MFSRLYEVADELIRGGFFEDTYKPEGTRDSMLIIGTRPGSSADLKLIYRGSPVASTEGDMYGRERYFLMITRSQAGAKFLDALSFSATSHPEMVCHLSGDFDLVERIRPVHGSSKVVRDKLKELRTAGNPTGLKSYQFRFNGKVDQTVELIRALMGF